VSEPIKRSSRRVVLLSMLGAFAITPVACKREERCKRCGMVIDPTSRWVAELRDGDRVVARFDAPKCALFAVRSTKPKGVIFLHGYYTQKLAPVGDLVLATGSDVLGPMGADFVPIEPEHASRFKVEHSARLLIKEAELTDDLVEDPR
jgi:hypothetical protein